tara:strand:- start:159 stop:287 length:129 start_codon:yes stop_codon:yes gene_type:complete
MKEQIPAKGYEILLDEREKALYIVMTSFYSQQGFYQSLEILV